MKPFAILLSLAALTLACCVFGQTADRSKISMSQAVAIVKAHLTTGMRHPEVRKVLEEQGFAKISPASVCRHSCFLQQDQLTNGYALELEYMPTVWHTNDYFLQLRTSRLVQASILSNGVTVMSITLTNAP